MKESPRERLLHTCFSHLLPKTLSSGFTVKNLVSYRMIALVMTVHDREGVRHGMPRHLVMHTEFLFNHLLL